MITSKVLNWIKRNWVSLVLVLLMIGMIAYHFFGTYNPPIQQAVIVSPATKEKLLPNGQYADIKVQTPDSETPQQAGFSERFVKDTIGKILGIKDKEQILAVTQVKGRYSDSLNLLKTELDEQKKVTKYYQSKDRSGNVMGTAKVTDDGPLVYKANLNLITTTKKGKEDKRGRKITPDSLIFYDPTQRATIYESKEYKFALPLEAKKKKIRFTPSIGIGAVVPIEVKNSKINAKEVGLGFFGGFAASYTF